MTTVDPAVTQIGLSVLIVHVIQWLKSKRWCPWITDQSAQINRTVAFLAAMLSSLGFSFILIGDFHSGGHIEIAFPALSWLAIGTAVTRMMFQAGIQQLYYTQAVRPDPDLPKTLAARMRAALTAAGISLEDPPAPAANPAKPSTAGPTAG